MPNLAEINCGVIMHTFSNKSERTFVDKNQPNNASSTADSLWYHSLDEPVPDQFRYGPLYGKQRYLATIICPSFGTKIDPRALQSLARQGFLWVTREPGVQLCQVYFLNQHVYEQANDRHLAELNQQKKTRTTKDEQEQT